MAVDIPSTNYNYIDKVVNEVQDKLDFFENKIGVYANDVSKSLDKISSIKFDDVPSPIQLPKPSPGGYEPLKSISVPTLNADLPKPTVIDIEIQSPKEMVAPEFNGLGFTIPDAPILQNDLTIPDFISASEIPNIETDITLPVLPTFEFQNIDKGELPTQVNLDELLKSIDLSDLELPKAPEAPIMYLPDVPVLNIGVAPDRPKINDDISIPDAPTIVLPDIEALEKITLPVFQFDEIPVFEGKAPEFNVTLPDNIDSIVATTSKVIGQDYNTWNTDSAIKPLVQEIRAWLDGSHAGTGLPSVIEQALFNRARERTNRETERAVQLAATDWASRGFSMPQGMLVKQIADIRDQGKLSLADTNRDIMIQSFDKQLEHIRFLTEQGIAT